nr:hypothetical protein [Candidatus Sigynarchaeota archaeon]
MEKSRSSPSSRLLAALKFHLATRMIAVQKDPAIHHRKLVLGFWITTIYALAYSFYEYFVVYNYVDLMAQGLMVEQLNWVIMLGGFAIAILIATRGNIEHLVIGMMYMFILEDLGYWISQWIDTRVYPFPAPDWFDSWFASFRVFGGIGQAIPFWPFVPVFYLPGFALIAVYYLAARKSTTWSRIVAWGIGPLFAWLIIGTQLSDATASALLIFLPVISWSYVFILFLFKSKIIDTNK